MEYQFTKHHTWTQLRPPVSGGGGRITCTRVYILYHVFEHFEHDSHYINARGVFARTTILTRPSSQRTISLCICHACIIYVNTRKSVYVLCVWGYACFAAFGTLPNALAMPNRPHPRFILILSTILHKFHYYGSNSKPYCSAQFQRASAPDGRMRVGWATGGNDWRWCFRWQLFGGGFTAGWCACSRGRRVRVHFMCKMWWILFWTVLRVVRAIWTWVHRVAGETTCVHEWWYTILHLLCELC